MKTIIKYLGVMLLVVAAGFAYADGKVNINTADTETLATELKGVGQNKALTIVEHREANGLFDSVDALVDVKGIGAKVLEDNAGKITVSD
jgi:competence protein ComEA